MIENDTNKKDSCKLNRLTALALSCSAVLMGTMSQPYAQTMDYQALQDIFGEPVTTSATGKPQRVSEVPVTMEILTSDDIRRSGAVDLPEVLRQVNGVDIIQSSTQAYDVSVRGYNQGYSQRLLVLVNGRQVFLDHFGLTAWSTIPIQLEEIRQIEVVKGPNTALFGFNAVSGVVNIVTYNPLYDDVSSAGVAVGSQSFRKGHYVQSMKVSDDLGVRVSAGARRSNAFNGRENGITPVTTPVDGNSLLLDPEQQSFNFDSVYQATDNSQVRLELSASSADQGEYIANGSLLGNEYSTRSAKLSYEIDSQYGLIKSNIYTNMLDINAKTRVSANQAEVENQVIVAQLEDTIQLSPSHVVRLGGEIRQNEFSSENGEFLSQDAELGYDLYAANVMWDWKINDNVSWTNAGRIDHLNLERSGPFFAVNNQTNQEFKTSTTEFSYNSGLVVRPTGKDTFRVSTARGVEVPSLVEYGYELTIPPGLVARGNPSLEPAIVTNYEVAWDRTIDLIKGMFRSAVFYQKTKNVKSVFSSTNLPTLSIETENIGESSSVGAEVSIEGKVSEKVDWGVGYIYQTVNDDLANSSGGTQTVPKEYEDSTSEHQIQLKLGYKNNNWELDGLFFYKSQHDLVATNLPIVSLDKVDSYVGVNARIAYGFDNNVTVALQGSNLQSSATHTSPAPDIERRVLLSISKKF